MNIVDRILEKSSSHKREEDEEYIALETDYFQGNDDTVNVEVTYNIGKQRQE